MGIAAGLSKNLAFWHAFPKLLVRDLSREQLRWQPEQHDTSIIFALWHAYRAEDDLVHGMVMKQPSVLTAQEWAKRLRVETTGITPFGNGLTREQIASIDLDVEEVIAYAEAVGRSEIAFVEAMSDEEALEEVRLPFFTGVYEHVDVMSKLETIAFFAIGHTSEHLGEVQMLKGMMGLKGAPL